MTPTEKWNEICDCFYQNIDSTEEVIQVGWEMLFADAEIFGYSQRKGEVNAHRNLQIGSTERVIPDIIIKKDNSDLFVVELKRETLPIDTAHKNQLFSYLKQLRLDLGILICDQIAIFDYDYNIDDDKQIYALIEFKKDNPLGSKFVELFSKENFDRSKIKEFIKKCVDAKQHISEIKKELTNELVKKLAAGYFTEKYSTEETEEALKDYVFTVNKKQTVSIVPSDGQAEVAKHIGNHNTKNTTLSEAKKLVRDLRTVGISTFVKYFEYYANPNYETGDVKRIMKQKESWSENSYNTKSSTGKSIVKRGLGKQALQIIANSNNVEDWVIKKARELLRNMD